MFRVIIYFFIPFTFLFADNVSQIEYLAKLQKEAIEKNKFSSGVRSEVNTANFILSPEGKTNPQKELEETLKSFFDKRIPENQNEFHPQCRYIARYKWLKAKLEFNAELLPEIYCPAFTQWKNSLNPKSMKVIFASYYMGAPASVYGHTLMKLDTNREDNGELLDYGINFAANQNPKDNPIEYVINGLFGLYDGQFAIFPYYFKVNEYNEAESRDMWEYRLSFNTEEIEWAYSHLWELGAASFPYYFFSDNCSYHILSILEIARPSLRLREKVPPWVIPSETVKVINEESGLVAERIYRPSLHSKIKQRLHLMNEAEREIVYKILSQKISPDEFKNLTIEEDKKGFILDATLDVYRFRKANRFQEKEEDKQYRKFLTLRANLPQESEKEYKPMTTSPETGHSIVRFRTGLGSSTNGNFAELGLRPAHHDLLNQDSGFVPNSENLVLNFRVRTYFDEKKLFLEESNFLKIASFSPYNSISKLNSYLVNFGTDAAVLKKEKFLQDPDYKRVSMGNLEGLYGFSFQNEYNPTFSRFMFSVLSGVKMQSSHELKQGYRAAPQLLLNFIGDFGKVKFVLSGSYYGYSLLSGKDDYKITFQTRYSISLNHELRVEFLSQRYYNEAILSYSYLF